MEWTDIFSGPAFEPVKSRELHLGKDCDLSRPLVVRDTDKLTVEVAGGAALRLVVLHTKPCQAEIRIKLLEGADAELVQLFSAEAFVDFQVEQAAGSKFRMTACQFTSANVRYRFDLNGREASNELDVLFLALEQDHCVVDLRTNHLVPDCTSRSLIKGVASGTGRGEFCGLVYVAPDAQHTDAQQQCRNILLSRTSRIDARPQLEIYADDVSNAFDPNWPETCDKRNNSQLNYGVAICKYTGSRGKGGASDASAEAMGHVRSTLDKAGVIWQIATLGKVDQGGGGTVAAYMANRNIVTVDAGVPVLSMHAPLELVSKLDCYETMLACKAIYLA